MVDAIKTMPSGLPTISPTRDMIATGRSTLAYVILGLDPRIHSFSQCTAFRSIILGLAWILGSSPRMTAEGRSRCTTQKQRPWAEGSYRTVGGLR
ncbi:Hypothetical protein NGAL_HAMBI1189_28980 [Neorhizobium galegae bv. officinalis]|uniref:Uncharacterized protein n=1 Tax=Neorhizobium galegae bv. officinalis TaxID=323656 RepID=A0A0T7GPU6_NEOGA|nr:Hypothetical protein NGAL_HAMBI1189_28980 [Neorhizobium galegae bv. officinalis]